jgi:hypothetical protein
MAANEGRADVGVGLGRVAGGVSPESESDTKITPAKLRTGHVPSPENKCTTHLVATAPIFAKVK